MSARKLAAQAAHPQAPQSERTQARAELERIYAPTASDLPAMGDVSQLVEVLKTAYEQEAFAKASVAGSLWGGTGIMPAPKTRSAAEPKSLFVDERGMFGAVPGGYKRRPSQFGPEHLRLMVENTPLINAIILRRCRTVSRFLRPVERGRDVYFEIRKNDAHGTVQERKGEAETALEQFLLHSGTERDPSRMHRLKRDHLRTFITKSLRDILTLDAWAVETVPTRNGKSLTGYHAIDGATVYLASEDGYMGDDAIIAVQIVNGLPVTTYTAQELTYQAQNPRTDVWHAGYGYAPPEMIVKIVTGYLNALTYNLKGFDANSIPKGLLTLFGSFDEEQLKFFKQQWAAMVKGVNNAWALPVLASEGKESGAAFTKFGVEFTEMYFAKWMVLLTAITCSVYGMDPTEIYSEAFHAGRSSLAGSDVAEKLADARDTGLEPLLTFVEDVFTHYLIARIDPDYVFRFVGLHPLDQAWEHEVAKLTMSVKQLKEQQGVHLLGEAWEDAPLNPVLQGAYAQAQQAMAGGAMPGRPGQPGEGDGKEPEATVEERGDRGPKPGGPEPVAEETGSRDLAAAAPPTNRPEPATRDREDVSTMMRKALDGEIVVVG